MSNVYNKMLINIRNEQKIIASKDAWKYLIKRAIKNELKIMLVEIIIF